MIGQSPLSFQDDEEVHRRAAERGVEIQDLFVAAARAGGATTDEWTYIRKDGSRLTVLLTITGMRGSSGALEGFIGIASDITERKAVEQMKDQFVLMVSHELRTPLVLTCRSRAAISNTDLTSPRRRA